MLQIKSFAKAEALINCTDDNSQKKPAGLRLEPEKGLFVTCESGLMASCGLWRAETEHAVTATLENNLRDDFVLIYAKTRVGGEMPQRVRRRGNRFSKSSKGSWLRRTS